MAGIEDLMSNPIALIGMGLLSSNNFQDGMRSATGLLGQASDRKRKDEDKLKGELPAGYRWNQTTGNAEMIPGLSPSMFDKAPSGYRSTADGNLAPIPGGPGDPANKPMNEYQGKSALFAARMAEANPVLDRLKNSNTMPQKLASGIPLVGNYLVSDDFQQLDQAKKNFVNATLRQESGAAINSSEFENADKQYFPQPGDRPEVIAQKARNRATALQMMAKSAGKSFSVDDIGGDPSIPPTGGTHPLDQFWK